MSIRVHPWLKESPGPVRLALCALPLAYLWWVLIKHLSVPWSNNPQYAYGWAVPFLCAYLIWRRVQKAESRKQKGESGEQKAESGGGERGTRSAKARVLEHSQIANRKSEIHSLPSAIFHSLFCFLALAYAPTRLIQEANPEWSLVSWALALIVIGLTLISIHCGLRIADCGFAAPPAATDSTIQQFNDSTPCRSDFGFRISDFGFPIGFFLVAVPWPSVVEGPVIQGLTRLNTALTVEILGWLNIPAIQHGNVIEIATGSVGIDEACSGIRSLQATLMLSLFFGELYRLTVLRRTVLCLTGFALAMLCNLGRMLLLTWVAARQGEQAIAGWHDPAGVTILVACFIGVWLFAARQARRPSKVQSPKSKVQSSPPAASSSLLPAPYSLRFALCSAIRAIRSIPRRFLNAADAKVGAEERGGGFSLRPLRDPLRPLRFVRLRRSLVAAVPRCALAVWLVLVEIGVAAWYHHVEANIRNVATWHIAWPEERAGFRDLPIPARVTELLRYDEARQAQWLESDSTRWQLSWFYWKPGQAAGYLAKSHTPLICMPAGGYGMVSASPPEQVDLGGLRFPFRIYSFEQAGTTVYVLYSRWEDHATEQSFATESPAYSNVRLNLLRSIWTGRGNRGQRVITMGLWSARSGEEARELLVRQLEKIVVAEPPAGAAR